METLTELLDRFYFGIIEPLFLGFGKLLHLLFLTPLQIIGLPLWIQIGVLGILTALLAFLLRKILRVEEKTRRFNERFGQMRRQQEDLDLINDRQYRNSLYKTTDDDLNDAYNTFLAGHYGRYVTIYLLPIFLILAWLNAVYSGDFLTARLGSPYVIPLKENKFHIQGLSVTFIFLVSYILTLIVGFRIRRLRAVKHDNPATVSSNPMSSPPPR